ncbi:iron-containing alcohol dehydrogenase [Granulicatella sp. zg-ZJ]|uniref:iron-containing alcohol dehydrogenase family protein n=1 Tax=Granulicatella sp. zg-ZJ TaxID=2678504 RepID=UPI0013D2A6CB|nr:iron-containing alcohol dehydrogenase family protein [Granulicatella sp. zg-ZJ]NEW62360.1 iron-containing alcohol dehydrogenase [Granulicatella sp. zg-ZJ]
MRFEQVTRSTPGQYISEAGALVYLSEKLKAFDKPYIVTGEKSYEAFLTFTPDKLEGIPVLKYDKTSSHEDGERLATLAKDADVIVAIGGGKVCDTAKIVAERLNCDIISVPTVLGTCAPTTPVAAVYHPDKTFKMVDYFSRTAYCCIVDLTLLAHSPKAYFEGGVCDTLVKWYEAESIVRHVEDTLEANVALGLAAAKVTQEILLRDTPEALKNLENHDVTPAFKRVVDTVFNVAAAVGCFACEYGRMSGAHAVHNALSLFKETHAIQHGVKVSYGLLVQLAAMNELEELQRLILFYKENGFIYSWHQLGIEETMETAVPKMASFAASDRETFRLAVPNVQTDDIVKAVHLVEKYV